MYFDEDTIIVREGQTTLNCFFTILEKTDAWNKLSLTKQNVFKKLVDKHFDILPKDSQSMTLTLSLMFSSFLYGCGYDCDIEDWR